MALSEIFFHVDRSEATAEVKGSIVLYPKNGHGAYKLPPGEGTHGHDFAVYDHVSAGKIKICPLDKEEKLYAVMPANRTLSPVYSRDLT